MVRTRDAGDYEYEGIHLTNADFTAGKDEGDTLEAGTVGAIATAEVGEDGQLSSYDRLRIGDRMDKTGKSPKGKIFIELRDAADEVVDDRTQVRLMVADKNSNRRLPVTRWYPHRDLNIERPDLRTPLEPVTKGGKPWFIRSGRLVVLEVKNQAGTVEVDLDNSTFEFPSRGGY